MPLTNEERGYIQGMQQQILNLQARIEQLEQTIRQMQDRALFEAGQRSAGHMPTGIDPNGGRRYGGGDPQEPKADHDRWEDEGGK